jgi:hypothetical protein
VRRPHRHSQRLRVSEMVRWWSDVVRPGVPPQYYLLGRCPKDTLLGKWRHVREPTWPVWVGVLSMCCFCATVLLPMLRRFLTGGGPLAAPWWVLVIVVLFFIGSSVIMQISCSGRERRFERILRESGFSLCLKCGYNLRGLPEVHNCPECGSPYDIQDVRRVWTRSSVA